MPNKLDLLESKIRKVLEELHSLRRENARLESECGTFKSQIALTGGEGRKVQRALADYDHLKRSREEAAVRVERALQKLSALRI